MAGCCNNEPLESKRNTRYGRVLWIALVVNASMFGVEIYAGWSGGSVSLLADAIDFFGDAANYGISLFVLALSVQWRSRAALLKGLTMGGYGVFILVSAAWHGITGTVPEAATMGIIGSLALAANLLVAVLLFTYRNGDANMRSVWLCTRNDAIGNLAVLLAALGVFSTGSALPDLVVAVAMGTLALTAGMGVVKQARRELNVRATAPVA